MATQTVSIDLNEAALLAVVAKMYVIENEQDLNVEQTKNWNALIAKLQNVPQIDLEQFMIDVQNGTGFTFNTFHRMFRYVNERYFGCTLYAQIKNGEITVEEVVRLMKAAM